MVSAQERLFYSTLPISLLWFRWHLMANFETWQTQENVLLWKKWCLGSLLPRSPSSSVCRMAVCSCVQFLANYQNVFIMAMVVLTGILSTCIFLNSLTWPSLYYVQKCFQWYGWHTFYMLAISYLDNLFCLGWLFYFKYWCWRLCHTDFERVLFKSNKWKLC